MVLNLGGMFVPRWQYLAVDQQDQLRAIAAHWPIGGDGLTPPTFASAVDNELARLPIFFAHSTRLTPVGTHQSGARITQSILTDLALHVPTQATLNEDLMHHAWSSAMNLRDFGAARQIAASLHKRGWPGRQIGLYLATYGYVNKKGIVGAWHHKRLSEALSGGLHV